MKAFLIVSHTWVININNAKTTWLTKQILICVLQLKSSDVTINHLVSHHTGCDCNLAVTLVEFDQSHQLVAHRQ